MSKYKNQKNHPLTMPTNFLITILCAIPLVGFPTLIDGITYPKVAIIVFCTTPFIPLMLRDIYRVRAGVLLNSLVSSVVLIVSLIIFQISNDYRAIVGAPGRHNGLLTLLLYLYYIIIGIHIHIYDRILTILKSLVISAAVTSIIAIISSSFPGFNLFPSLSFSRSDFHDNVDSIAPLISMAMITSLILYLKSKKMMYIILQIPMIYFLIEWQLLQPVPSLIISVSLILVLKKFPKNNFLVWSPFFLFGLYIFTIKILPFTPLVNDPSVLERRNIINYTQQVFVYLSLLPTHIDGLSDLTRSYDAPIPGQFLDDFHNFYIQTIFSYGLIVGFAIVTLCLMPFFVQAWKNQNQLLVFPVYGNFAMSLLFGIASPNYMFFGFILIGYLIGDSINIRARAISLRVQGLNYLVSIIIFVPFLFQVDDLEKRLNISTLVRSGVPDIPGSNLFSRLVVEVGHMPDAEYRFRVAKNFYVIGQCLHGDAIFKQMLKTNSQEIRILALRDLRAACGPR